jgi:hypothetical protein
MIPFNKPHLTGKETAYIEEAVRSGKISGDGMFTKKCHTFFEQHFGMHKALLTTSCTDALEMTAILANIQPGDEVIVPSYTFVSTANAFVLRGAHIVFADSRTDIDRALDELIRRTKLEQTRLQQGSRLDLGWINPSRFEENVQESKRLEHEINTLAYLVGLSGEQRGDLFKKIQELTCYSK